MVMRSPARRVLLVLAVLLAAPASIVQAEFVPLQRGDYLDPERILPLGTRRHDVDDSLYTGLAALPAYQAVGSLSTSTGFSSGTLIASNYVLTAAHSVFGAPASSVRFTVGGQTYFGSEVFILPGYTGDLLAGNDLAIVRLTSHVTNVTPAALNSNTNEKGLVGTMVGFGATGTGDTGYKSGTAGTKRAGQNVLDEFGDFFANVNIAVVMSDFDHPDIPGLSTFGSSTPLDLEYSVAPGDSGGGLFVDFGSGPVLAAVHSWIYGRDGTNNASYGDLMGSVRVSIHYNWIMSVIPEPSSYVLLALGMIGVYGLKRRCA
jgi:secreted trypsin-like serine protease